jgi:hypothetical protein
VPVFFDIQHMGTMILPTAKLTRRREQGVPASPVHSNEDPGEWGTETEKGRRRANGDKYHNPWSDGMNEGEGSRQREMVGL